MVIDENTVVKLTLILYEVDKKPRTILSTLKSGDSLIIGRGQNVQLWVNDKNISREHCKISCVNGEVFVEDLASRNGTFVNKQRIHGRAQLKGGEQIRLASSSSVIVSLELAQGNQGAIADPPTPPPPGDQILQPGEIINGYRIERRVGEGGMAVVYKATHLGLNRPVAIKTLVSRLIQNPKAIKRFANVAKVASVLTHPNIVQIFDSGRLDKRGIYYIVMEYVEGQNLNALLKEYGKLPLDRSRLVIGRIASALEFANKHNIIHRDINPSNILVGEEDVPKLIGLGLAKCLNDEVTSLTQPGQGMGMVGYIAPEQLLDASKADHRSDVYSLGAVFYRCLCGQTPYDTKNIRDFFSCIHKRIPPPRPHEVNQHIPRTISDMILKALEYNPEKRFQSITEFILALKAAVSPDKYNSQKIAESAMSMLPQKVEVENFEFDALFKPYADVGGDFYDFIELNDKEIGIVIGDVTGHGIEAAIIVGMIKMAVKIFAKQYASTTDALKHANKEVFPDLDQTTFATVFYGIINREKKTLRFSRAGHNPLILYNPNRAKPITTYHPEGKCIGMFAQCELQEMQIQLQPGDCLIQYTDGVTEAMNSEQEEYGMEKLCETIRSSENNIQTILGNIEKSVEEFVGAEKQQDDIAVIGVKVL
ncbi:SpoIIE family protein phosphatase [Candidatus Uabimicrobium amorphum]|uniref:Protein kinase n=1 Tax=Uabimicrobium amorphum TaxID=2596890 RepID=A0A5S9IJI6_UABAM|nr:SpoIIE family protein phosphatase [Candidatus Uabimicrobium amorphum]BBM81775.1 protein kinase [Candidatus Uabimicrobium amorphum]